MISPNAGVVYLYFYEPEVKENNNSFYFLSHSSEVTLSCEKDGTSTIVKNGQNYTQLELDENETNALIRQTLFGNVK